MEAASDALWLFRGMKEDAAGGPAIEASARGLGVRPGVDVPAVKSDDLVMPGDGGLSVAPDDPHNLPYHRRPSEFEGVGRDPVWVISDEDLGADLSFRVDPSRHGHGFIEPARPMALAEYADALSATRGRWLKASTWPLPGGDPDAART